LFGAVRQKSGFFFAGACGKEVAFSTPLFRGDFIDGGLNGDNLSEWLTRD
jgi:hypothetical protein